MTEPVKCPEGMVYIPAGEFTMGATDEEVEEFGAWAEQPRRPVYVSAFCMDRHEVTNSDYSSYTSSPSPRHFDKPDQPVRHVEWQEAVDFCRSQGKRLPTEAEWEKAARGPDGYNKYGTRSGALSRDEAHYDNVEEPAYITANVCSYPENGYGLCDMAGNVWEWVFDSYENDAYEKLPYRDPKAKATFDNNWKVIRGGGLFNFCDSNALRAAHRNFNNQFERSSKNGFRCAADPLIEQKQNFASVQPPKSCLCNTPGHVGGGSKSDISFLSLITMLFFD